MTKISSSGSPPRIRGRANSPTTRRCDGGSETNTRGRTVHGPSRAERFMFTMAISSFRSGTGIISRRRVILAAEIGAEVCREQEELGDCWRSHNYQGQALGILIIMPMEVVM